MTETLIRDGFETLKQFGKPETQKVVEFFKTTLLNSTETNSSVDIIKGILDAHPEMLWLTGDVEATPESSIHPDKNKTIGEILFPNLEKSKLTELNRTAVGILCLYWAYIGGDKNYELFTECQKVSKLSRKSFEDLHLFTRNVLPKNDDFNAMLIYTIINDLGKIKSIVQSIQIDKTVTYGIESITHEMAIEAIAIYAVKKSLVKIEGIVKQMLKEVNPANIDHDKLLLEGLEKTPQIAPSFNLLEDFYKNILLTGLRGEFNMGQFLQAENVPANISKLRGMDEKSYDFYMIHFLYDLAGAAGQFVQNGSVVLNEDTYVGYKMGNEILKNFIQEDIDEIQAYDNFLDKKAEKLEINIEDNKDRAIVRICCMLRFSSPEKALLVKEVFETLPRNVKAILENEMNKNGINDGFASLVYYSPALLVNLQKSMKSDESSENFKASLSLGLITLARIYQEARISLKGRKDNGVYTVMASNIAKIASENPEDLTKNELIIKNVGDDAEIDLKKLSTINIELFPKILDLSEIPGNTILPIGIGGGSDCIQAAQLAFLLRESGKNVPAVVSVRTIKTNSQGINGQIGEDRTPQNSQEISDGVFLINSETKMSGRSLEPLMANSIPTYLILIKENVDLTSQLEILKQHLGNIETIIGVDTGGDALYSTTGHDQSKATPDQDIQVLQAINKINGVNTISAEIAVGIDTPENGEDVLNTALAIYFEPNKNQSTNILENYKKWHMDGSNEEYFGKTALAWQKTLLGNAGIQVIDLPTRVVIDDKNPWNTFVNIQPATKGIFFMNTENHLNAIGIRKPDYE